ncbi:MAG: PEFG-CTERM sorting domain-containing protein [Nitrosopumilaceae archaeon]
MQKWKKILIYSVFVFLIMYVPENTIAQLSSDEITASTNSLSYKPGEKVAITGTIKNVISGNPVTILIRNPIQNVYAVGQVKIHNNVFVHDFLISDNSKPGTYTVDIKHGEQSARLQFTVSSGLIQNISVESSFIKVRGDVLGLIKYKNVHISPQENSITIQLSIDSPIDPIPQEFEIPKEVIDAEQSLIIEIDEKTLDCSETETGKSRILDCFIPQSARELKIIGTSVIPEFGSVALLVLVLSIASLIAYTKIRTG